MKKILIISVMAASLPISTQIFASGPGRNSDQAGFSGYLTGSYRELKAEAEYEKLLRGDTTALVRLHELAQKGNPQAQNLMGVFLDQGLYGMRQDHAGAARYFHAASNREALAAYNLGLLYLFGRGVERNQEAAMQYFRKAAGKRIAQAYVRLGINYYSVATKAKQHGESDPKAMQEAEKMFRLAAQLNDPVGEYYFGRLLVEGANRTPDYKKGMAWLTKAAKRRNADAARLIAYLYENGLGIEKSLDMAATWMLIHLAVSTDGKTNLDQALFYDLPLNRMKKAREQARQWLARHPGTAIPEYVWSLARK